MTDVQHYLNPITVEAKLFVKHLEILAQDYNVIDMQLMEALESVMIAIENFVDKNENSEIVDTNKTRVVKCDDLKHIQRIFHCGYCKRDLGKNMNKVVLHVANECESNQKTGDSQNGAVAAAIPPKPVVKKQEQPSRRAVDRLNRKQNKMNDKINAVVKINKKTLAFLTMDQQSLFNFLTSSREMGEALKYLPDYKLIEDDIMAILKPVYPEQTIKIYQFGSRMTGIGTRESDLDIFIDVDDRYRKFEHCPTKESIKPLYKLRDAMLVHRKTWKGMIVIDSARVPIIKIIHAKTGIECDINVTNSMGHINTQFLEYLFSLQPMTQLMCTYMKKWLSRTNQKSEFNTYSMTLMVIFYMQMLNFLPPISKFFDVVKKESALTIGPWISSFGRLTLNDLRIQKANVSNLLDNVKNFFEFYLNFDYSNNIICPYAGKLIQKNAFRNAMPDSYTAFITENKDADFSLNRPMTVQDPIQLNNNVTKNISEFNLEAFKEYISRSLGALAQN